MKSKDRSPLNKLDLSRNYQIILEKFQRMVNPDIPEAERLGLEKRLDRPFLSFLQRSKFSRIQAGRIPPVSPLASRGSICSVRLFPFIQDSE